MTDAFSGRDIALDILLLTEKGMPGHLAEAKAMDAHPAMEKRERAFAGRLSHGVLERMIEMDYCIGLFSKTPVGKMRPAIRNVLRMGAYELLYMDGVPDRAACGEAVRLAEKRGFSGLKGFVNGVMRAMARAHASDSIEYPDEEAEPARYLSVAYSMPPWLAEHWIGSLGYADAKEICADFLRERPTTIRVNPEKTTPERMRVSLEAAGIRAEIVDADALRVSGYDRPAAIPGFSSGDFYVQDLGAIEAVRAADICPGWNIIDVCAAPGGKAIHAAQIMRGAGHVEARDLTEYKAGVIRENIRRCGVENMSVKVWDATVPDPDAVNTADLVIADVPCSGLGVLHAKPDIKYRMDPEKMRGLAALQRQILSAVRAYVKPGGRLLYVTCTVDRAENEENAAWFAGTYQDFSMRSERQILPDEKRDGFYIAVFDRNIDAESICPASGACHK